MFKIKNTDKVVSMAKMKSESTKQLVIDTINAMIEKGEDITFYSVYKKAGVSKSFVYNNQEVRKIIESQRKTTVKKTQTQDAKDIIIESQKHKIKELENELSKNRKDELWKEKYEKLKEENEELKLQLEKAYEY